MDGWRGGSLRVMGQSLGYGRSNFTGPEVGDRGWYGTSLLFYPLRTAYGDYADGQKLIAPHLKFGNM